jgi:PTH1 family peptidyl-tRNA hydrolase
MLDYILAGLGNPGPTYTHTRHNLGFSVVDYFLQYTDPSAQWLAHKKQSSLNSQVSVAGKNILCVKPQSYMNLSGTVVQGLCSYYKLPPQKLIVAYDDIALGLGQVKISQNKGSGGHKGVQNILDCLGPGFIAFRVGIGPKPIAQMALADYVLSPFSGEEKAFLETELKKMIQILNLIIDKGPIIAMNILS